MPGIAKTHLVIVRTDDDGNHHVSGGNVKEFPTALEGNTPATEVKSATEGLVSGLGDGDYADLAGGKRSNARRTRSKARRSKVGGKRSRARRTKSKRSKSTRRR